jgi:hypothetical protein
MHKTLILISILFTLSAHANPVKPGDENVYIASQAYEKGDNATALAFFLKAAEAGNSTGQYNLGQMYLHGLGTAKNFSEAFKWFNKALDQGDTSALAPLGIMYLNGEGVAHNEKRALSMLKKSAALGDEQAKKVLTQYEEHKKEQARHDLVEKPSQMQPPQVRSIYDRIDDVLKTDLNLSNDEAKALIKRTFPKCKNVEFSGPIAGSYREMYVFAQMNREMSKGRDGGKIFTEIERALDRGLSCRRDVTNFIGCQGFSYSNTVLGELGPPSLANYKKYGQSHADYVEVYTTQIFKSGRSELVPVYVEKKNMRCIGSNDDPGMYSKTHIKLLD